MRHPSSEKDVSMISDRSLTPCQIGSLEFSDFAYTNTYFPTLPGPPASAVTVTPSSNPANPGRVVYNLLQGTPNAGSTLTTQPYPTLNAISIARLRHFLDALKMEGIYVNINLHVGYQFRPDVDGVPELPGGMPTQSKPLHIFYPRMVELQKQYARQLLEGVKLKGDPVLAMVEIDNETSLLQAWMGGSLDKVLLGDYLAEWRKQWDAFAKQDIPPVASTDTTNPRLNDYLIFLEGRDRYYLDGMKASVGAAGIFDRSSGWNISRQAPGRVSFVWPVRRRQAGLRCSTWHAASRLRIT